MCDRRYHINQKSPFWLIWYLSACRKSCVKFPMTPCRERACPFRWKRCGYPPRGCAPPAEPPFLRRKGGSAGGAHPRGGYPQRFQRNGHARSLHGVIGNFTQLFRQAERYHINQKGLFWLIWYLLSHTFYPKQAFLIQDSACASQMSAGHQKREHPYGCSLFWCPADI